MPHLDTLLLKERLASLAGRFDVDVLAECDSTSSELLRRATAGAPSGSVVLAERQWAGRGRRGRSWAAQPADSPLLSQIDRFLSIRG